MNIKIDLPEGFLEKEVLCGHTVNRQYKKLWAVELDLLNELDRVCRQNGISYQMDGGSLIGAIRHNGFIPWDNDIDIMMFRDDYDRFIKLSKEFKHPYFLQTHFTDKFWNAHCRLRNSDTSCFTHWETINNVDYNKGIFIDIFPFDNIYLKKVEYQASLIKKYKAIANNIRSVARMFPLETNMMNYFYDRYENIQRKYNNDDTNYVANLSVIPFKQTFCKKIEDCAETIDWKFETLTVPVPKNYKNVLDMTYPGWETPVKGTELHNIEFFDTEKSYLTYNLQ